MKSCLGKITILVTIGCFKVQALQFFIHIDYIPASSAPFERFFSIAGRISLPDRCRLNDETFQKLLMINVILCVVTCRRFDISQTRYLFVQKLNLTSTFHFRQSNRLLIDYILVSNRL